MIYPIHVYGMPVLRKVARDIDNGYEGLEQLIADMYETMYQAEGVGLHPTTQTRIRIPKASSAP